MGNKHKVNQSTHTHKLISQMQTTPLSHFPCRDTAGLGLSSPFLPIRPPCCAHRQQSSALTPRHVPTFAVAVTFLSSPVHSTNTTSCPGCPHKLWARENFDASYQNDAWAEKICLRENRNGSRRQPEHGAARAWQNLAGKLPLSFPKSLPSPPPADICHSQEEGRSPTAPSQRQSSPGSSLTTQCTRMLRGIQKSKEKTSTEPTILSARNFPGKSVQIHQ